MFERLRERFVTWAAYRETIRQLGFLDQRLLDDAGIGPSEVRTRARAAVRARS